eukprot:scaffold961_cov122-Cylindrotheca_fusiformis.AAC.16
MKPVLLLLLPTVASSFSVGQSPTRTNHQLHLDVVCCSAAAAGTPEQEQEEEGDDSGLVLDGLDQEMNQFKSQYSFTETDYLAAARKRAEERRESVNSGASDEEWKKIAEEKESQYGTIDDWENSIKEAGNADSKILMFTEPPPADGEDDGEGSDPKLLLF